MSEELNVVEEKKDCNCPVCKLLKSDCTKKFLTMTLASFIGCSLAILAFAPKKPPRMYKCPPPCMKMMDRPFPPHHFKDFNRPMHPRMHKGDMKRHGEFKVYRIQKDEFRKCRDGRPNLKKDCPKKLDGEIKK